MHEVVKLKRPVVVIYMGHREQVLRILAEAEVKLSDSQRDDSHINLAEGLSQENLHKLNSALKDHGVVYDCRGGEAD